MNMNMHMNGKYILFCSLPSLFKEFYVRFFSVSFYFVWRVTLNEALITFD